MEMFSKFRSFSDLMESILLIFERIDADNSGTISFEEMADGLKHLLPNTRFSLEDWNRVEHSFKQRFCKEILEANECNGNVQGFEITESDFQELCLSELQEYLIRESNKVLILFSTTRCDDCTASNAT